MKKKLFDQFNKIKTKIEDIAQSNKEEVKK